MSEPQASEPPLDSDAHLARATVAMTALTAVSRLTGFVRIAVVAAVLGTTFLGNTYQSANTVPNLLFELLAAGALQAVLIPTLIEVIDAGNDDEAQRVAGSVLGLAGVALAVLSALGLALAPWVMRGLVSGVDSAAVRDEQVRLGVFFLWFFLPQTVLYAAGLVSTGVLNARGRFALPVAAPIVNNVVVIASYLLFWHLRDGRPPTLDLSMAEKVTLAGGTTLAVVAFCAVPVVAVIRSGFSLRPRFDLRHPLVRRLGRQGLWAGLYLALTQVLLAVMLVMANRVEGGVVAYQVAFTFFLLPHALFALPALTALFPRLARQAQTGEWPAFAESVGRGTDGIAFFALPAAAALAVLGPAVAVLTLFGESRGSAGEIGPVIQAFAPGLVGYGVFLLLTRAFYARGDTRTPAVVNAGVAVGGGMAMIAGFAVAPGGHEVAGLAAGHSIAYLVGTATLLARLVRSVDTPWSHLAGGPLRSAVAAAGAGLVMVAVAAVLDHRSRTGALVEVVVAGGLGTAAYLGVQRTLRPTGAGILPALVRPRRAAQ